MADTVEMAGGERVEFVLGCLDAQGKPGRVDEVTYESSAPESLVVVAELGATLTGAVVASPGATGTVTVTAHVRSRGVMVDGVGTVTLVAGTVVSVAFDFAAPTA